MTLAEYRDIVRNRIDDNSSLTDNIFSDTEVNSAINWARSYLNKRVRVCTKYDFIFPELYIDEYSLPSDFLKLLNVVDIYEEANIFLTQRKRAEVMSDSALTLWYNQFSIDEKRRRLTFLEPPESDMVQPNFTINGFTRASNTLTINATDSGNSLQSDIGYWSDVKGFAKLSLDDVVLESGTTTDSTTVTMADTTGVQVGCDVSGAGIPTGTTVVSITPNTSIVISEEATATATVDLTFSFDDEYIGNSKIVDTNGDGTLYTLYIPRWDLKASGNGFDYNGGSLKFATYLINYIGIPDNLVNDDDEEVLPNDVLDAVVFIACYYLYFKISDGQGALFEQDQYEKEIKAQIYEMQREEFALTNQRKAGLRYLDWER